MRFAVHHAFIVAAAVAALSLFATERAWAPASQAPEKISGAQPEWKIVLINPDTGKRAKAVCDSEPARDAQRDWLKGHCRPDDPTANMDSFFDVWTEISFE
jgi:hypothetical protein